MITQEQVKERQNFIGGSDAGAVLGLNPYMTPRDVYKSKIEQLDKDPPQTERQLWGNLSEDMIAKEFTRRTGFPNRVTNEKYLHKKYPFLGGNLDRVLSDPYKEISGILEIKTRDEHYHKQLSELCPDYDYAQVQHYFNVTGYKFAFYAVLVGNKKLDFIEIEKSPEFISIMEQVEIDFWKDYILKEREPDAILYDNLNGIFKNKKAFSKIEATRLIYQDYVDLKNLKMQISHLSDRADHIVNKIKLAMGENEILTSEGLPIVTWKTFSQKRVDPDKLKKRWPRVYVQVLKTIDSARFNVL